MTPFRLVLALIIYMSINYCSAEEVIPPDLERPIIKEPKLDNDSWEIGFFAGVISIEDFDTNEYFSARIAKHFNEHVFIEANYGISTGGTTTNEDLNEGIVNFPDDARDYKSWDVSFGWNIFSNESWLLGRAYNSDVYILSGIGTTEFAEDKWTTANLGIGYRLIPKDWIMWRIEARDYIFDRDLLGKRETTNNITLTTGLTILF